MNLENLPRGDMMMRAFLREEPSPAKREFLRHFAQDSQVMGLSCPLWLARFGLRAVSSASHQSAHTLTRSSFERETWVRRTTTAAIRGGHHGE
ncbi:hypothetical protein CLOM_g3568 [Closterium sp. NIES-68]|nr:hypothetical protein CLOM_g3568 [Closterium sp. NIES-68]